MLLAAHRLCEGRSGWFEASAELIHADWFLQRATRTYADMEAKLLAEQPNPLEWTEQQDRKLGRFLRYKTGQFQHLPQMPESRRRLPQSARQ
jgi:hypothetical protein